MIRHQCDMPDCSAPMAHRIDVSLDGVRSWDARLCEEHGRTLFGLFDHEETSVEQAQFYGAMFTVAGAYFVGVEKRLREERREAERAGKKP